MKLEIKQISAKKIFQSLGYYWMKIHSFVFFAILLGTIIIGLFIWRQSLYGSDWSEKRKQDYLDSQNKSITFKEDDFKKVLDNIKTRQNYNNQNSQVKDIFVPYK